MARHWNMGSVLGSMLDPLVRPPPRLPYLPLNSKSLETRSL